VPYESRHLFPLIVVPHGSDNGLSFGLGTRKLDCFSKDLFWNINCGFHASNFAALGFDVNGGSTCKGTAADFHLSQLPPHDFPRRRHRQRLDKLQSARVFVSGQPRLDEALYFTFQNTIG